MIRDRPPVFWLLLAVALGTYVAARVRGAPFWQATVVLILMTWATLALDDYGYLDSSDNA